MDYRKGAGWWLNHKQCLGGTGIAALWQRFREAPYFFNFKDLIMYTRLTTSFAIAVLALSLGACSNMSRQDQNTVTGAAIGGVAGAVLTGGSTAGTVGGAAVGGVIGHKIGY